MLIYQRFEQKTPVRRPGHNCRAGNNCRAQALRRRRRGRVEQQPKSVDAVTQSGRLWRVLGDVTEMATAAAAMDFGTQHPEGAVLGLADGVVDRLVETRPA